MIITRLRGGLGNQLFQYVCGRALSLRASNAGNLLKLDVEGYAPAAQEQNRTDTKREYSLSHFSIVEDIASADEIRRLKYPFGIVSKGWRFAKVKVFRQFNTGFVPRVLSWTGNIYLDGFWQSELYFKDAEETIRKELTLKKELGPQATSIAEKIKTIGGASVSLHVRRGDVARDAATNPYFGICTPTYYEAALTYIKKYTANPHIFIFSDDPAWVKENIKITEPHTFISDENKGNLLPDYEELVLMSMCAHNIIANSSFSWWGAWLNANPSKIIVAPKEWITRSKRQHKDIAPPSWIRL